MKKIIVTLVVFALVAGAAFAQPAVGGNLKISTNLLAGSTETEDPMAGGTTIWDAHINVTWSGTNAGGLIRFWSKTNEWMPESFAFWWWKPIEQVRIQLGRNRDADFGHAQIAGWGFNAEAQGGVAVDKDRELTKYGAGYYGNESLASIARTAAWWGGFGAGGKDLGLALSIYPIPGFEVDICVPMQGGKAGIYGIGATDTQAANTPTDTAANIYLSSKINFNVAVPDIGNLRFVADLQGKDSEDKVVVPNIHAAFYINAVEGMGIEIGAGFKDEFDTIEIGAGYRLTAEALVLKARVGLIAKSPNSKNDSMLLGIGILPSYNLGKLVTLFNAGFGIDLGDTAMVDWFINPYISVPANSGRFYGGIKLHNIKSLKAGDEVTWAIPIGWNIYF